MTGDSRFLLYIIYFLVAVTVILAAEAVFLSVRARRVRTVTVNHRLGLLEKTISPETALVELRKERGLDAAGQYRYAFIAFNRLYLQSGLKGGPAAFFSSFFLPALIVAGVLLLFFSALFLALFAAGFIGLVLPLLVILRKRASRRKKFIEQLPDALDIVVRSLRAGHPTPIALSMLAKEMADPIGSEFGIVCDEMMFGMAMERAMRNLLERVGADDLRLVVIAIGIQSSIGGNLAEILGTMSQVVRDRFRMRRKIKAISSEGRWSAVLLSLFPLALFAILLVISPSYYRNIWSDPIVKPTLMIAGGWMLVGDFIMWRMVNFDF